MWRQDCLADDRGRVNEHAGADQNRKSARNRETVDREVLHLRIWCGDAMRSCRPPLFWKRTFESHVIVTCVRWCCRFCLSLRDLKELMGERGLAVDHTTIWRWTQHYGPEVLRRLQSEMKRRSSTWHMDETLVRIAGKQIYFFRAVDSHGAAVEFYLSETRDRQAAKLFLQKAMANPDNPAPRVFVRNGLWRYPAAIRELKTEGCVRRHCRQRMRPSSSWSMVAWGPSVGAYWRTETDTSRAEPCRTGCSSHAI
jgi:transposase-like protein